MWYVTSKEMNKYKATKISYEIFQSTDHGCSAGVVLILRYAQNAYGFHKILQLFAVFGCWTTPT